MKKSIVYFGTIYNYTVSAKYPNRNYSFPAIELVYCTPTHPDPISTMLVPTVNIRSEEDLYLEISEYFEGLKRDTTPLCPLPESTPDPVPTAYYALRRSSFYDLPICEYFPDRDTMFKKISKHILTLPKGCMQYVAIICENHMCYPIVNRYGTIITYKDLVTCNTIYTYHRDGSR